MLETLGIFVFFDHLVPAQHSPDEQAKEVNGTGAHPHRGIATLTYILNGEADHFDSNGNHTKVRSGGVQWMKAGTEKIHDEAVNVDGQANDYLTHSMQFWVNLPSKNKAESPMYAPIQSEEIPKAELGDGRGSIKVVNGEYGILASKIPNYSRQFIYHIKLEPGKQFSFPTEAGLEYAAFLPLQGATIMTPNTERVIW